MSRLIKFGWRIPDFPLDGTRGKDFIRQITDSMDVFQESFDSAWQADHFLPWADFQDPKTETLEAWTTIAYLAGRYTRLMFGNIVLCQSYRSPALLAKMAATLQTFTNGRLILAIGAGWKEDEYHAYGYEFPTLSTRFEQLEETAQILRLMWSEPSATFIGKHYRVENAICEPKPVPVPPLMIGGGGKKKTLRITARYADWWNYPGGNFDHYSELINVLKNHCVSIGRDYNQIVKTWMTDCVAVAPTHASALKIAQANPLYDEESSIVGTPDEVAAYLQRFVNLGVQHFIFRFADFPRADSAQLFIKEVLPRFF